MYCEPAEDSASSGGEESEESEDGEEITNRNKREIGSIAGTSHSTYETPDGVQNPTTNPTYGNKMRLFSRTHHFLAVYPDGIVRGTEDRADIHTRLELISIVGDPGHLRIRGLLSNMYVAMNARGRVYAAPSSCDDNTVFIQNVRGYYQTYLSREHAAYGWYLAIKRSGKMKNGRKTQAKQKAVQFLSVRKT